MLSFSDVQRLVEERLTAVSSQADLAGALRSYRTQGGEEAAQPWYVAGFYAYEGKNKRLVLETLYLQRLNTCVVRVFRERGAKILYAGKAIDQAKLASKVGEAAEVFLLHLKKPLPVQLFEGDYAQISPALGESLSQVLSPIPPPVNLAELED